MAPVHTAKISPTAIVSVEVIHSGPGTSYGPERSPERTTALPPSNVGGPHGPDRANGEVRGARRPLAADRSRPAYHPETLLRICELFTATVSAIIVGLDAGIYNLPEEGTTPHGRFRKAAL